MIVSKRVGLWCHVCAVPLSGGGGSLPFGIFYRQSFTVPAALAPWHTAQFLSKSFLPRAISSLSNQLSPAWSIESVAIEIIMNFCIVNPLYQTSYRSDLLPFLARESGGKEAHSLAQLYSASL